MWDNPRILNLAAGTLVGIALFVFAAAAVVLVLRSPLFPVTAIELTHALGHTTREEIAAAAQSRIGGNFFAVDPAQLRAALEELPWVRRAAVRRVWPDRLEVTLEEHVPLARWGTLNEDPQKHALIDVYGERFGGSTDEPLPVLAGPAGTERELAQRYVRFARAMAPLGAKLERVVLSERRAWQLTLDNGLHLMLGRDADAAESRLARFVEAHAATLGRIPRSHGYVDLRYPNGFALRVPELPG
jgi:cell division protein FtsQ